VTYNPTNSAVSNDIEKSLR